MTLLQCDVKFLQIKGNGIKFRHIELSNKSHQFNFLTVCKLGFKVKHIVQRQLKEVAEWP